VSLVWSRDARYTDERLFSYNGLNENLLKLTDVARNLAWGRIVSRIRPLTIIMTRTQKLGLVPQCRIEGRGEIWTALGCGIPLLLRPQPNGAYWHVCAADIPKFQKDELLQGLSTDIQLGDKIGEWTVEDIYRTRVRKTAVIEVRGRTQSLKIRNSAFRIARHPAAGPLYGKSQV
jgi:hypothetical protein